MYRLLDIYVVLEEVYKLCRQNVCYNKIKHQTFQFSVSDPIDIQYELPFFLKKLLNNCKNLELNSIIISSKYH